MAKDIEITKFYEMLCDTASIKLDDRSRLYMETGSKDKKKNYCTLLIGDKEKDIIFPTYENLRDRDIEKDVFFHPLGESIQNGKSEVFDFLHRTMLIRLNVSLAILGVGLLTVQDNPDVHGKFDKDQIEIMKGISESDSKSVGNWSLMTSQAFTRFADNMSKWNANISVKRKGMYQGKEYKRVGVVSFPALEYVEEGNRFLRGEGKDAKDMFRKVDYKTFSQVTRAVFPGAADLEAYNAACNGSIAPYLIAFLKAYANVADRINGVIETMDPIFKAISFDSSTAGIPLDWLPWLEEDKAETLSHWLRRLPSLEGNQGRLSDIAEVREREQEEELARKKSLKKEVAPWEDEEPQKAERKEPQEDRRPISTPDNPYGITKPIGAKGGSSHASVSSLSKDRHRQEDETAERERRQRLREIEEREARIRHREAEEAAERRRRLEEREREEREYEESRRRREARDREERDYRGGRGRDDGDRDRDRDDRERGRVRDDESLKTDAGKLDFTAMLRKRPEIVEGTPTYERERDYERSGSRRSRYFDSDDRDRDDRDYRDRDRGYRGGRDRDDGWGSRRSRYR